MKVIDAGRHAKVSIAPKQKLRHGGCDAPAVFVSVHRAQSHIRRRKLKVGVDLPTPDE